MSLARAFVTLSGLTLVSRVLGFVRDVQMAALLGAGPMADAFLVAFKLPNLFRKLFAEGAFNAAFVPLFSGTLASEGAEQAKAFAREALAALSLVLVLLSAVAMMAMPLITQLMAPGFSDDPEKFALTVELSRITFPYLFFISITSLLVGMLNSLDKFAAGAIAPVLLNLALIIGLALFAGMGDTPAHVAAWCVFAGGVAQCVLLLWWVRREGMWLSPQWPRFTPQVRKLLRLMGPAALGGGVSQLSVFLDVFLASGISGAVSYLYYADRVHELPLGMIGIALGTAVLPRMSRQLKLGDLEAARNTQNRAIELALLFSLPAMVAIMLISRPIAVVLFEHGAFSAEDSAKTASAMVAYSVGVLGFVLVKIFIASFFAGHDTKTPVKIALFCLTLNLILNLSLIPFLSHVALALSSAITGVVNASLLGGILYRKGVWRPDARLFSRGWRMVAATVAMGVALWLGDAWVGHLFVEPASKLERAPVLVGLIAGGAAVYGAAAWAFGVLRWSEIKGMLRRKA